MNENKLKEWIEIFIDGGKNDITLFIDDTIKKNDESSDIFNNIKNKFKIIDIDINERFNPTWKNIMIFKSNFKYEKVYLSNYYFKYENLSFENNFVDIINKCVAREIIYIKNFEVLENLVKKDNGKFDHGEVKYIDKKNFKDFKDMNEKELDNFIKDRQKSLALIYRDVQCNNFEFIPEHIILYKQNKILTAKFAHYLYRISELNFCSTVSSIGVNIRKILGVGSSTVNYKKINVITSIYEFKNFKAYNLNNIDFNFDFKKRIANKLLDSKEFNLSKIAKITELPLEEVQKLYKKKS